MTNTSEGSSEPEGRRPRRALAVCYRLRPDLDGGVEVLLIRTRAGLWTLPGGRVDEGESPAEAAAREAFEEAGVSGHLHPRPVTEVTLVKRPSELLRPAGLRTPVFRLEVLENVDPEESFRLPEWVSPPEGERRLRHGRTPWTASMRLQALRAALRSLA
jgi:8-oxo-dGTP pyrophosphatase MutT (NUDIX family)